MFLDIAKRLSVSLESVPAVGDSLRDLQAARAAGARPVLVRTGNGRKTEQQLTPELADTRVYDCLADVVAALLSGSDGKVAA